LGIAFEEDGPHTQAVAELYIGERITDHDTGFGGDIRKLGAGLKEEPGEWLAAVASVLDVGAEVEGVDVCTLRLQPALQLRVDLMHILGGVLAEADAALVGDHNDTESPVVETRDSLWHPGQRLKFAPRCYISAFRQFAIENAVTVQEDGVQGARKNSVRGSDHIAMIAAESSALIEGYGDRATA
jgi:hypothetical protein